MFYNVLLQKRLLFVDQCQLFLSHNSIQPLWLFRVQNGINCLTIQNELIIPPISPFCLKCPCLTSSKNWALLNRCLCTSRLWENIQCSSHYYPLQEMQIMQIFQDLFVNSHLPLCLSWCFYWGCKGDKPHWTVRCQTHLTLSKCYLLDLPLWLGEQPGIHSFRSIWLSLIVRVFTTQAEFL